VHPRAGGRLALGLAAAFLAALLPATACREPGLQDLPELPMPRCGDGRVDPGEGCDGADLAGQSCQGEGFDTGTLTCSATCGLDLGGCVRFCGNGVIDTNETCDGTLGLTACTTWGYTACNGCKASAARCVLAAFPRSATYLSRSGSQQTNGGPALVASLPPSATPHLVLAVSTPAPALVLVPHVNGTWADARTLQLDAAPAPGAGALLAADVDADDRADLAVLDAAGGARVMRWSRTEERFVRMRLDTGGCRARAWLGAVPRAGAVGQDLVVRAECPAAGGPDEAAVLVLSAAAADAPVVARASAPGAGAAAVGDVDGDGLDEVLHARAGSAALHSLERSGAGFAPGASTPLAEEPVGVAATDLDADGDVDAVVADAGAVRVLRNDGGVLTEVLRLPASAPRHLLARDLDGDERPDVAWAEGAEVRVARNDGALAFRVAGTPTGRTGEALSLAAGDVDGDGDTDVAATYPASTAETATAVLLNGVR
jgi:hypothetical protein